MHADELLLLGFILLFSQKVILECEVMLNSTVLTWKKLIFWYVKFHNSFNIQFRVRRRIKVIRVILSGYFIFIFQIAYSDV